MDDNTINEILKYLDLEDDTIPKKAQHSHTKWRLSKKLKEESSLGVLERCLFNFIKDNLEYASLSKQMINIYLKKQHNQQEEEEEEEKEEEQEEEEEEEEEEEVKYEYPLKVDRRSAGGDIIRVEYRYEGNKVCSSSDMYFREKGGKNNSGMIYDQSSHYKGEDLLTDKIILRGCKTEAGNKTIDLYYKRKDGVFELEELNITNQV